MGEILNKIKERRSIREYEEKQISDDSLNNILEAATFAPSGQNKQNWIFTAIQNKEILSKLNLAIKNRFSDSIVPELKEKGKSTNFSFNYNAPTFIIVSAPRESLLGTYNAGAALQNIFLAAHEEGLGSVWIHALTRLYDYTDIREILTEVGIPETHVVTGSAAIGYIKGDIPSLKPRKEGTISIYR